MATILRTTLPHQSATNSVRLNFFPGRHLGESEFDLEQTWVEFRLAPLLAGREPGIVVGLDVHIPEHKGRSEDPDIVVNPGIAINANGLVVTLSEPIRARWSDVVLAGESNITGSENTVNPEVKQLTTAADGLYVVVVERQVVSTTQVEDVPMRRDEMDPLRDSRLDWSTRLVAHPFPLDDRIWRPRSNAARETIANAICALYLPTAIHAVEDDGVALVLLSMKGQVVEWSDALAVRREAVPSGARWTLYAMLRQAILDFPLPSGRMTRDHFVQNWNFDYLPAAGTLPISFLLDPASPCPTCPLFPPEVAVEMTTIPVSTSQSVLKAEISRGPLVLSQNSADRVRLFVAVPDANWRPDLMVKPRPDGATIDRLQQAYVAASLAWWNWCSHRLGLYAALGSTFQPGSTIAKAREPGIVLSTEELVRLGAIRDNAAGEFPESPDHFVRTVLTREELESKAESWGLPEPYSSFKSDKDISLVYYKNWERQNAPRLTPESKTAAAKAQLAESNTNVVLATDHGLVVERAFLKKYLEGLAEDLVEINERIQLLRDHAMEHRQQFDAHTVNLASLAGGVGTDGLGLSIARWLPYINLGKPPTVASSGPVVNKTGDGAANPTPTAARSTVFEKLSPTVTSATSNVGIVNSARDESFGVMRNIRPDVYTLDHANHAYRELYDRLQRVQFRVELDAVDAFETDSFSLSQKGHPEIWKTKFVRTRATRTSSGSGRLSLAALGRIGPDKPIKDLLGAGITSAKVASGSKSQTVVGEASPRAPGDTGMAIAGATSLTAGSKVSSIAEVLTVTSATLATKVTSSTIAGATSEATPAVTKTTSVTVGDAIKATLATEGAAAKVTTGTGGDAAKAAAGIAKPSDAASKIAAAAIAPKAVRIGKQDSYRWSVALGQRQAKLIGHIESLLRKWEAVGRDVAAEIEATTTDVALMDQKIAAEQIQLIHLDEIRRTAEDDYRMARVLADEDWVKTELTDEERTRLLTSPLGLYYARVRQTNAAVSLSDPLPLRHQVNGKVVPGAADEAEVTIPEALDPFLHALWEVPMGDWRRLRELAAFLPELSRLTMIAQLRYARILGRADLAWTPPYARLASLLQQSHLLLNTVLAGRYYVDASWAESQRRAMQFLSIADLSLSPFGRLRDTAQLLRRQWEQAIGALLAELKRIPAAQRFDWAQLAEDDRLAVNDPAYWPGLRQAAGTDDPALHLRTFIELVQWCNGQLVPQPSAGGTNAVRNMLRALIIHSAHGDVSDVTRGRVMSLPARLEVGAPLRVQLERQVPLGSQLLLISPAGAIFGTARVDDHDQFGTAVRLLEIRGSEPITTGFTVATRRS